MKITPLAIPEVLLITPARHGDERGWFSETFRQSALEEAGFKAAFVQDNHVRSTTRGIQRGLHYQKPPHAQDKLLRCVVGAIFDVAVDIRKGSPMFGRHIAIELSGENKLQLYIPRGFAHGFIVLSETAEFFYKCDNFYDPSAESGVSFDDPFLGIDWKVSRDKMIISEKDTQWKNLNDTDTTCIYEK